MCTTDQRYNGQQVTWCSRNTPPKEIVFNTVNARSTIAVTAQPWAIDDHHRWRVELDGGKPDGGKPDGGLCMNSRYQWCAPHLLIASASCVVCPLLLGAGFLIYR
jgi:hypothetical protein